MSMRYKKPLTEKLLSLYHKDKKDLLTVDLFSVNLLSLVVILRYILRLGFRIMFFISKNSLYRGSVPYILL